MIFTGSAALATIFELGWLQALVAWIAATATSFFVYLSLLMTRKLAVAVTAISIIFALALALFLLMRAAMSGIYVATPDFIQNGINCIIPSNFVPCLSAVLGSRIALQVYRFKVNFVNKVSS